MKQFLSGLILAGFSTAALASELAGPYASVSAGLNILGDQTYTATVGSDSASSEASFDGSFAGGGAIGYRFANRFSVEAEFLYRRVELDSVDLGDLGSFSDGDFANTQINLNAYYHFELDSLPAIEPYVGAGLAYINELDTDLEDSAGVEREFEADEFGVELMAGARFSIGRRGFADLGVRYLPLGGVELERSDGSGDRVSSDYDPFMVTAKFGWRF